MNGTTVYYGDPVATAQFPRELAEMLKEKSPEGLKQEQFESMSVYELRKEILRMKRETVPLWHKTTLTVEEAAEYSGIGGPKLREISNDKDCKFVLYNGNKRLFKRELLDEYLLSQYSI